MREVERVRDGFRRAVLAGDPDAAVALCAEAVVLVDLPVGAGATGRDDLRRHLTDVAAHLPADLAFARLSRTVDRFRVVDEERVTFTHDQELRWLLPGPAVLTLLFRPPLGLGLPVRLVPGRGLLRPVRCGWPGMPTGRWPLLSHGWPPGRLGPWRRHGRAER